MRPQGPERGYFFGPSNRLNILKTKGILFGTRAALARCVQNISAKLSAFNLYVDDYPAPGTTLVHNTFSGAYVLLEQATLGVLQKVHHGEPLSAKELDLVCDEDLADPDVGILVQSLEEEEREYRSWFDWRRSRHGLQSIIGINLACNFDCPYCCQAEVMDGSVMKREVAEHTADWLAARALEVDAENVHLVFVGGEPLLHPDRLETIAARVKAAVEPRGIEVTMGLITNGYFLGEEMVRELLPYGLEVAQVTLDGDETTHHLSRVSKQGENTFARIFNNIVAASRHIRISVNGNYQDNTVSGFAPLIKKLSDAGMPSNTKVSFTPALEILGAPEGSGSGSCTWSQSAFQHRVALHDEILRHGFETAGLGIVGPCGFHDRHLYSIDHLGNVFKCPGFLGHPEWRIGTVTSGLTNRYQKMLTVGTDSRCGGCSHRPNCAGGCLANEFLRTGETTGVNCEIDYFDAIKRDALVREYLLSKNENPSEALAEFPPTPVPGAADPQGSPARGIRPRALRVL